MVDYSSCYRRDNQRMDGFTVRRQRSPSYILILSVSNSVGDLGVLLDNELTMQPHINKIYSAWFYHLRRLQQLRRLIDRAMMQRLVSAFVISRLDYCNSTLAGLGACALEPLQRDLAMVRLVAGLGPCDHVMESMKDLHWLPIAHRIKFKLCTLMPGAIFGQSPSYIRDLLVPVSEMQGYTSTYCCCCWTL